jgi:hypothetical protein
MVGINRNGMMSKISLVVSQAVGLGKGDKCYWRSGDNNYMPVQSHTTLSQEQRADLDQVIEGT